MSNFDFEKYLKRMIDIGCCTPAVMSQFVVNAEALIHINPYEESDEAEAQCDSLKVLRELIATSDKWLPILEADICEMEANSQYFTEKKEFEEGWNWGYGNYIDPENPDVAEYDAIFALDNASTRKEKGRKKHGDVYLTVDNYIPDEYHEQFTLEISNGTLHKFKKKDRKHGKPVPQSDKKYWDEQSGTFYRWDEKKKTFNSRKKPVIHRRRKTFRDRLDSAMTAREQEDARLFTGYGELLEDINYLEDRIRIYEEDIKDLEYEKAFGYLTEKGEQFLEDYKKELKELKEYKQYKEVLLRTATH